jgi:hypothetical protein
MSFPYRNKHLHTTYCIPRISQKLWRRRSRNFLYQIWVSSSTSHRKKCGVGDLPPLSRWFGHSVHRCRHCCPWEIGSSEKRMVGNSWKCRWFAGNTFVMFLWMISVSTAYMVRRSCNVRRALSSCLSSCSRRAICNTVGSMGGPSAGMVTYVPHSRRCVGT